MGVILFASGPFTSYAAAYILTGNATSVTTTSAVFGGYVDGGNSPTRAWFEYGTDPEFKNYTFTNAYSFNPGQRSNFSSSVLGLNPNTTYSFRAVAQNSAGRVLGNTYSFTTNTSSYMNNDTNFLFLTAITEPAGSITSRSVELNSLIYNEANEFSNTWFEWGTSPTNLNNKTTVMKADSFSSVRHKDTLTGLTPSTTYYFRAVAENFTRQSNGSVLSFTTTGSTVPTSTSKSTDSTPTTKKQTTDNADSIAFLSSVLPANVLGAGSFFPTNIFGWLILIILVLIVIILSKNFYSKPEGKEKGAEEHA